MGIDFGGFGAKMQIGTGIAKSYSERKSEGPEKMRIRAKRPE